MPARAFVPLQALQVKLGDQWIYSMPMSRRPLLRFGEIPWYCEGQVALVVKDGPEEFIPVPFLDSAKSITSNVGTFELSVDGTLTAKAKRTYTGHAASVMRGQLIIDDPVLHRRIVGNKISGDLKGAGQAGQDRRRCRRKPQFDEVDQRPIDHEYSGLDTPKHLSKSTTVWLSAISPKLPARI